MLAPLQQPPPFPNILGVSDANALLVMLVERPEELRKFLSEYRKLEKDYKKAAERYRDVTNLDALFAEAEENKKNTAEALEMAKESLEAAEAETAQIMSTATTAIADARVEAADIISLAKTEADEIQSNIKLAEKESAKKLRAGESLLEEKRNTLRADVALFAEDKKTALDEIVEGERALATKTEQLADRARKVAAAMA